MYFLRSALLALTAAPLLAQPAALAWQRHTARSHAALAAHTSATATTPLPPAPTGVTDLAFADFFAPIGDRGLEYSPRLRALDGQMVRLVGYMVREAQHTPGLFLLAGWPTTVDAKGLCSVDTSPPSAVHVFAPTPRPLPFVPGRLVLIGRLALGPRPEADGRNSTVRLTLDPNSAAQFSP